jgi:hypothetical protein
MLDVDDRAVAAEVRTQLRKLGGRNDVASEAIDAGRLVKH